MSHVHNTHGSSIFGWPARVVTRWHNRRVMSGLLKMDDYMLNDIGLQRGDVQNESERSLWRD